MLDIKISPSILSADWGNLEREITKIEEAGADLIHVDVMDGHFVPNLTFGFPIIKFLNKVKKIPLDVHLMISNPEDHIDSFCKAGANYLTVHQEATTHLDQILRKIKEHGVKGGVALNPGTNPLVMPDYIYDLADMILVMGVNPGYGGQKFIPEVLASIRDIRNKNPTLDIEVDGGIDCKYKGKTDQPKLTSVYQASKAGANIFVAGTAIFKGKNYETPINEIRRLAEEGRRLK
ncbi:MAG: ribulose-phosphate 3-epimerase [archaeon]